MKGKTRREMDSYCERGRRLLEILRGKGLEGSSDYREVQFAMDMIGNLREFYDRRISHAQLMIKMADQMFLRLGHVHEVVGEPQFPNYSLGERIERHSSGEAVEDILQTAPALGEEGARMIGESPEIISYAWIEKYEKIHLPQRKSGR